MAAIPAGDQRSPRRSLRTIGDLNAHVIGTCWSSSIPNKRASGSWVRSSFASSSNVIGNETVDAMAAEATDRRSDRCRPRAAARDAGGKDVRIDLRCRAMRDVVRMWFGRVVAIAGALVVMAQLLVLAPTPVYAAAAEPPPVPDPFQVEMTPTGFVPSTIDVVVGQSVVFTNHAGAARKVQATSGLFDSGTIPVGGAFTVAIPDERTIPF